MASNNVKVVGIRNAVSDIKNVPKGFHVEVWSEKVDNIITVWTSEYLSQNSWTINHHKSEHRLDVIAREIREYEDVSMTEALKQAVRQVYEVA